MKCVYHPDRNATLRCSQCDKPLCGGCAIAEEENRFVCIRCMALKAAHDAVHGTQERLEELEEKRQIRESKRKKSPYLSIIVPIFMVLALILIGMNIYFRSTLPISEAFDQPEHPLIKMLIVDEALHDYSKDHKGTYPTGLSELIGQYIPPEEMDQDDLDDFAYERPSPHSFELRSKETSNEEIFDVVFTEEDWG